MNCFDLAAALVLPACGDPRETKYHCAGDCYDPDLHQTCLELYAPDEYMAQLQLIPAREWTAADRRFLLLLR